MHHTVMIIDDSPLERLIAETLIKRTLPGDQIVSFSSAMGALNHLQSLIAGTELFPKVIFLDIHMPIMNGFDFLDKFLEFPETARAACKVVMFSSTENGEDHAQMRRYPLIQQFLRKPLSPERIDGLRAMWQEVS